MKSGLAKNGVCCNALKGVDLFGEQVNLTFKSAKTYNTTFGGFISILCLFLLGSFFITRTSKVLSMSDPFFSMTVQVQEEEGQVVDLWDLGLYFAI